MAKFFSGVFNYVFNELLVDTLANSRAFQRFAVRTDKALKEAFESFFNKSVAGHSVPELMASFSDAILKKGGAAKLLGEDDIDSVLDKIVEYLEYISDRDMIREFYRQRLSRRLMNAAATNVTATTSR